MNYHEVFADLPDPVRFQMNPHNGIQGDYRNKLVRLSMVFQLMDMGIQKDHQAILTERLLATPTYTEYQQDQVLRMQQSYEIELQSVLSRLTEIPQAKQLDAIAYELQSIGSKENPLLYRKQIEQLLREGSAIIDEQKKDPEGSL